MNFTGFRDFVLVETSAVDYGRGMDELQRLNNNHLMLVHQADDREAWLYPNGEGIHRDKLMNSSKLMDTENLAKLITRPGNFALVIAFIPKRWFKQSKENILGQIDKIVGLELPNNYVWGILSKVNHEFTRREKFNFYRNPNYHAHDELYDRWNKTNNNPVIPQKPIPLEKAPTVAAPNFPR